MFALLRAFAAAVRTLFCSRADLVLENLALRQQLAILARRRPRRRLCALDRAFWVGLAKRWPGWRDTLAIVRPATVIRWHRLGFRLFWRLAVTSDRTSLDQSRSANTHPSHRDREPRLGARESMASCSSSARRRPVTVAKYMPRRNKPPSQTWRTFLRNHMSCAAGIDFFTIPTVTFRVLYGFVVLGHGRRRILHLDVTEHRLPSGPASSCAQLCRNRRASSIATVAPPSRTRRLPPSPRQRGGGRQRAAAVGESSRGEMRPRSSVVLGRTGAAVAAGHLARTITGRAKSRRMERFTFRRRILPRRPRRADDLLLAAEAMEEVAESLEGGATVGWTKRGGSAELRAAGCGSIGSRVLGDVEVEDAAPSVAEDDEAVEDAKGDRRDRKEVDAAAQLIWLRRKVRQVCEGGLFPPRHVLGKP